MFRGRTLERFCSTASGWDALSTQEMDRNLECYLERKKKPNQAAEMVRFAEIER